MLYEYTKYFLYYLIAIYHRNKYGNTKYCHKQFRCGELEYGISRCLTHAFYKEIGIYFTHEDWKKISVDALKYKLDK